MRDAAGDAPEPFKPLHPTESGLLGLVAPAASLDKDNQDADQGEKDSRDGEHHGCMLAPGQKDGLLRQSQQDHCRRAAPCSISMRHFRAASNDAD